MRLGANVPSGLLFHTNSRLRGTLSSLPGTRRGQKDSLSSVFETLVAHDYGYPLSRYTCRATHVAADFLDFIAFCRCSTGVALHPLKILVSHLPPRCAGRCRTEIWV